jgi:hypothetical protein
MHKMARAYGNQVQKLPSAKKPKHHLINISNLLLTSFFSLNEDQLKSTLATAPTERSVAVSRSGKIIIVPDAEGTMQQFRIAEISVLAPQLAAKYPGIKTYIGQGVDDKTTTIHFDITPSGFHAMVMSASKPTYYINPVDKDNKIYIVNARNLNDKVESFKCEIDKSLLQKQWFNNRKSIYINR